VIETYGARFLDFRHERPSQRLKIVHRNRVSVLPGPRRNGHRSCDSACAELQLTARCRFEMMSGASQMAYPSSRTAQPQVPTRFSRTTKTKYERKRSANKPGHLDASAITSDLATSRLRFHDCQRDRARLGMMKAPQQAQQPNAEAPCRGPSCRGDAQSVRHFTDPFLYNI
jgi:hypothetical protein